MTCEIIRHPGPAAEHPFQMARGQARRVRVVLGGGQSLMQAVAGAMDKAGCDSGVMTLDGLTIGPYDYVMPGPSHDGIHAAWYSKTHSGSLGRIRHGSAIVGRREGAWWLHCHAVWDEDGKSKCGHLLPDDVTLPKDAEVTLYAFDGGLFDVSMNPETQFPIFHPTGGADGGNALIAKVNPHHDISDAISAMIAQAAFSRAIVVGIGSLIGAQFETGEPMASPISEVLILPGAQWDGALSLPMYCVDPKDGQFSGSLLPGLSPVCVTFELLIMESPDSSQ
ncbi:hypothetical protein [Primorskyibacter sp. 2E233]|uniref:hypothetical protein n=1 Tax=Primorskyibacter sp. 2E233 TaxID=3413431 RepID=UPI003BEFE022